MNRWVLMFLLLWASCLAIAIAKHSVGKFEASATMGGYAMAMVFASGIAWKNKP